MLFTSLPLHLYCFSSLHFLPVISHLPHFFIFPPTLFLPLTTFSSLSLSLPPFPSILPHLPNFPLLLFPAIPPPPPPPLKHHTIPSYPNPAHPRSLPPSAFISLSLTLSPLHLTSSQPEHPHPTPFGSHSLPALVYFLFFVSLSLHLFLSCLLSLFLSISFSLSVLHFSSAARSSQARCSSFNHWGYRSTWDTDSVTWGKNVCVSVCVDGHSPYLHQLLL